jgi:hypothetical protein
MPTVNHLPRPEVIDLLNAGVVEILPGESKQEATRRVRDQIGENRRSLCGIYDYFVHVSTISDKIVIYGDSATYMANYFKHVGMMDYLKHWNKLPDCKLCAKKYIKSVAIPKGLI